MLLEVFLTWNSVIQCFQCEVNRGIRIAPSVGDILIEQDDF